MIDLYGAVAVIKVWPMLHPMVANLPYYHEQIGMLPFQTDGEGAAAFYDVDGIAKWIINEVLPAVEPSGSEICQAMT